MGKWLSVLLNLHNARYCVSVSQSEASLSQLLSPAVSAAALSAGEESFIAVRARC
jgi:hypothetical protein